MLKYKEAYEFLLNRKLEPNSQGEATTKCIAHQDENPSMSINLDKGLYCCHACMFKGNFFDFLRFIEKHTKLYQGKDVTFLINEALKKAGLEKDARLFLTYKSEDTHFRYDVVKVLSQRGGIKIKVRVLANGELVYTDTPNISSSKSRTEFSHKCFKASGADEELIARDLMALESLCETQLAYRRPEKECPVEVVISPEEREAAMKFLKRADLMDQIVLHLKTLGLVGEENNGLMIYLAATSRKLVQPISIIVKGCSSSGKSQMVAKVLSLMPLSEVKEFSSISPQSLVHMGETDLKHVIVAIYERPGAEASDYNLRVILSEGKLRFATVVKDESGNYKSVIKEVEGPVALIETTTIGFINAENETRLFSIHADESSEQTRRVHSVQRTKYKPEEAISEKEKSAIIRKHVVAQQLIQTLKVAIPFVDLIEFPVHKTRSRRDFARFLTLIETIALLHQFQRQKRNVGGEDYIVAELKDYKLAYQIAAQTLFETLSEIPRKSRTLLRICEKMKGEFTRNDIREKCGWSLDEIRKYMSHLVDNGFVEAISGEKGKTYKYKYISGYGVYSPERSFLKPDDLERKINGSKKKIRLMCKKLSDSFSA